MDYKIGDVLECVEIFSIDSNAQFADRVISDGDFYEVVSVDFAPGKNIHIEEMSKYKDVVYAGVIPISIHQADKYFKCKRIERKRKLNKIERCN